AFRAGCACDYQSHDVSLGVAVEGVDAAKVEEFKASSPGEYEKIVQRVAELNGGAMLGRSRKMPGVDVADAAALTRAEIEFRRGFFAALDHLRKNLPGYEKARIKETWPQIGVRQGRRVRGEYVLTDDDLRSSRHFDDGVGRLGVYFAVYGSPYQIKGLDYDVPYRCLVPAAMDGLLIAGRCVSSDYKTCNTMRLIAPCFVTGQAAGVAAALAVKSRCAPRRAPVDDLRAALRKQNVNLG
ncbi:MAG: FAD-dependent oxidoreductase, partial [Candidatus Sumerlaeota bacterium]|nr:FAD-dependent oxidoreductase [Candidatus Sumerlaeota bacterium]